MTRPLQTRACRCISACDCTPEMQRCSLKCTMVAHKVGDKECDGSGRTTSTFQALPMLILRPVRHMSALSRRHMQEHGEARYFSNPSPTKLSKQYISHPLAWTHGEGIAGDDLTRRPRTCIDVYHEPIFRQQTSLSLSQHSEHLNEALRASECDALPLPEAATVRQASSLIHPQPPRRPRPIARVCDSYNTWHGCTRAFTTSRGAYTRPTTTRAADYRSRD